MSDDFHRPTLTFPDGAYNATQVRLYGIVQDSSVITSTDPNRSSNPHGKISVKTALRGKDPRDIQVAAELKKLREQKKYNEEEIYRKLQKINFPPPPDPITLPSPIPAGYASHIKINTKTKLGFVVLVAATLTENNPISCGIIVGYSYEGHCYDLPKPKIMLIPDIPRLIPIDDCGYNLKYDASYPDKYMLWIVDKLDECVEFEINQGFVEQLVLEANLPGKRSPTMYASKSMMGHRSGRLGD